MVKTLIKKGLLLLILILSSCSTENSCDSQLIEEEISIDTTYNFELLFCLAYRDFMTDGGNQDIFVLKIDQHNLSKYLQKNIQYEKIIKNENYSVNNPNSLIRTLELEARSSKYEEKYMKIIKKINPNNGYYYFNKRENYHVESLIDKTGYIVLSISR